MPSPPAKFAIGQTPAQVGGATGLPARGVGSILVNNSSAGIGDAPNAPDIIVDTSPACALTPQQVGVRLIPGQLFTFSMRNPSNFAPLQLFAVADGPGGELTVVLNPDDSIEG
jgi:hypothetical protein